VQINILAFIHELAVVACHSGTGVRQCSGRLLPPDSQQSLARSPMTAQKYAVTILWMVCGNSETQCAPLSLHVTNFPNRCYMEKKARSKCEPSSLEQASTGGTKLSLDGACMPGNIPRATTQELKGAACQLVPQPDNRTLDPTWMQHSCEGASDMIAPCTGPVLGRISCDACRNQVINKRFNCTEAVPKTLQCETSCQTKPCSLAPQEVVISPYSR
jgi:hypothetical protein